MFYPKRDTEKIERKEQILKGYIYFDYEACVIDNVHVPKLIIVEKICISCINNKHCLSDCGMKKFYTNNEFCDWIFSASNHSFTAVAHKFQGIFFNK